MKQALVAAWYRGAGWLVMLRPLSLLFGAGVALRGWLYDAGLLRVYRAPVPVIVVGNLTVGGTGKTPTVIALARDLQSQGVHVGVVSRGYGGSEIGPVQVGAADDPTRVGDEALVLARHCACPCVIARNRPAAVRALLVQAGVDLVVSDDGLQHYALARDFEIALYDATASFGNGALLPEGPLREPLSRLQRADVVLARGGDDPETSVVYEPGQLVNLATGERRPFTSDSLETGVHAVAGLAQPGLFLDMLRRAGFAAQPHLFPDHHAYGAADLQFEDGRPVIMTEKDAVKCVAFASERSWYLEIDARLPKAVIEAAASLVAQSP